MSDDHERRIKALEGQRIESTQRHDTMKIEFARLDARLTEMQRSQDESRDERRMRDAHITRTLTQQDGVIEEIRSETKAQTTKIEAQTAKIDRILEINTRADERKRIATQVAKLIAWAAGAVGTGALGRWLIEKLAKLFT